MENRIVKVKIDCLIPADYNPRKLSEGAFDDLKKSLIELGQIKPIIVREDNNIIIAGHQRTKAMKAIGWEECDAFVLDGLNMQDEARFNQLHNRTEYEVSEKAPILKIKSKLKEGLNKVSPKDVTIVNKGRLAYINNALSLLVAKYGSFGMPIADPDGNIRISSAYAMSSVLCNVPLLVYVMPEHKVEIAIKYFSKEYGAFNYDSIKRKTYIQSLAQMNRLRKGAGKILGSRLYDKMIIPYLEKQQDGKKLRIIDFGAGHYAYAELLKSRGYNIHRVDPYHRKQTGKKGAGNIDFNVNKKDFLEICRDISTNGLYDIVICDSVLNSVDTIEAWNDVVNTCHALLKDGGMLFIAGRRRGKQRDAGTSEISISDTKTVYFLDDKGMTANFRSGQWFFQKFDNEEEQEYIYLRVGKLMLKQMDDSYRMAIKKTNKIPYKEAVDSLRREWNMLLPNNKRYGLGDNIENAYKKATEYDDKNI